MLPVETTRLHSLMHQETNRYLGPEAT